MSKHKPKEHLSIYRPTLLKERIAELEAEVERFKKLMMLANSQLTDDARKRCRAKAEKMGLYESGDTAGGE